MQTKDLKEILKYTKDHIIHIEETEESNSDSDEK